MKVINHKSVEDLCRSNRKFEAELLRGMRIENTLRFILGHGWFGLTALSIVAVIVIVMLVGRGVMSLPEKVVLALIGATVANASMLLLTIIRSLFSKRQ